MAQAEDYVTFQYLQYDESNNRTSVSAPSIMLNKDFGTDYTLNASFVADTVSGASPTYYDASSGASAYSRAHGVNKNNIAYGNVDFEEERFAGSALLTTRFSNRDELKVGGSYSSEHDFESIEGSGEYMHWLTGAKNNALSFGLSYQSNKITVRCDDTIPCDASSGASQRKDASVFNAQLGFFQNLNTQSYIKASLFGVKEEGYLNNPYLNVIRNYNGTTADIVGEQRPDTRTGFGASLRYANALSTNTTLQVFYRFYDDDWGILSHTIDTDFYYTLARDWTFKVGIRGYQQSRANFYSGKINHFTNEKYAASDERLSNFNALTYKSDIDYQVTKAFSLNLGANYYDQSTGLKATYFMTGFRYNF